MYYNREHLESVLETWFRHGLIFSKTYIDTGGDDPDTIYWDLELYAPSYTFSSGESIAEYRAIVSKWNARFRAEIDDYRRERSQSERMASERSRAERDRKEAAEREKRRREEEEEREAERLWEEERRRQEEEERRRAEARAKAEAKKKEQDKKNREELKRKQEEWRASRATTPEPQPQPLTESVFCPSCGKANAKTSKFCTGCGTRLLIECPSCGELVRLGSKFCTKCGSPIGVK